MDLCNESRSSGRPSCVAKALTLDIARKVFNHCFIPAVLIGAIDFCHYILLPLTLILIGGHKVSARLNPLGFIFCHTFQLVRMKFNVVLKQIKLRILVLLLSEI